MRYTVMTAVILTGNMLAQSAVADVVGWRLGANAWAQQYEGDVASGGANVDLEDELGYDDETGFNGYIALEHPVPVLPNILLQRTEMDADARGFVEDLEFDGIEYSGDVRSSLDLTHTDVTLYYEILDNWVNLDLGLTGRVFDDGVSITDVTTGLTGELDIDYVIPLVYAQARFDLPFSGLSIGLEGNAVQYDDDTLYDARLNIAYSFAFGLGIEGGYRVIDFEYDDDDDFADVTIDGVYGGLYWDF